MVLARQAMCARMRENTAKKAAKPRQRGNDDNETSKNRRTITPDRRSCVQSRHPGASAQKARGASLQKPILG